MEVIIEEFAGVDLPPLIVWAVPLMLFFVLVEYLIGYYKKKKLYCNKDLLASAGIGLGNLIVNASLKTILFLMVVYTYTYAPYKIPHTWWAYPLCYISFDFMSYWAHRISHVNRLLWSTHVPHHSSENYNFSVSFRLSWLQNIKIFFFLPVALLGFHPFVIFVCSQLGVLYQFWLHTQLIGKLHPAIEYIITTPSHHRVHHGTNPEYIDKNFAPTFIIFDRMFGTFQEEKETVRYGITKPVRSYNPFYLNFHEIIDIMRDVRKAKTWNDRIRLLKGKP